MEKSNEKALNLAKKLKALADQGVGGERLNASKMLERLMQQHKITFDMLEERDTCEHIFCMAEDEKKFFVQVAASELGTEFTVYKYRYKGKAGKGKERYSLVCTNEEFVFIMGKHEFFYNQYLKDLEIFRSAFVQKNRLFVKPSASNTDTPAQPQTQEEKAQAWKIANMMEGLDRKIFHKQLT